MMKNSKRVAKITGFVGKGHLIDAGEMKPAIRKFSKASLRHVQSLGACIDAVQLSNPRRDLGCPPTAAASEIESRCLAGKLLPQKNRKVRIEDRFPLVRWQRGLIKRPPFFAKCSNDFGIDITQIAPPDPVVPR